MARKYYNSGEAAKFKRIFGLELADYWNEQEYLGLDIIKFDEWLAVPEGQSMKQCIVRRFGQSAEEFVVELLMRIF